MFLTHAFKALNILPASLEPITQIIDYACMGAMVLNSFGMAFAAHGASTSLLNVVSSFGDHIISPFTDANSWHGINTALGVSIPADPVNTITSTASSHGMHHATTTVTDNIINSRCDWFNSLSGADQAIFQNKADMFGTSIEDVTRGWSDGLGHIVPDNWSPCK